MQNIKTAAHCGYLNPQILSKPLSPQTLQLLNELLRQIQSVQKLEMEYNLQSQTNGTHARQLQSYQIVKAKEQIEKIHVSTENSVRCIVLVSFIVLEL